MMYYKKRDVRYTDMLIWIDENVMKEGCDDEKLFEYLYLIMVMLAKNNRDFKNAQEYNDFGIFGATYMYFVYLKRRQKIKEGKEIEEIKSCKNYVKSILPFIRMQFQRDVLNIYKSKADQEVERDNYTFSDDLSKMVDDLKLCDFRMYLDDVPRTVRTYMQKLPKQRNSFEWDNIYISVLLTVINQMTLSAKMKNIINSFYDTKVRGEYSIHKYYTLMRQNPVILYRLDSSMENYVLTLAKEIKHLLAQDLSEMSDIYVPSDNGYAIEIQTQLMGEGDDTYGDYDARD